VDSIAPVINMEQPRGVSRRQPCVSEPRAGSCRSFEHQVDQLARLQGFADAQGAIGGRRCIASAKQHDAISLASAQHQPIVLVIPRREQNQMIVGLGHADPVGMAAKRSLVECDGLDAGISAGLHQPLCQSNWIDTGSDSGNQHRMRPRADFTAVARSLYNKPGDLGRDPGAIVQRIPKCLRRINIHDTVAQCDYGRATSHPGQHGHLAYAFAGSDIANELHPVVANVAHNRKQAAPHKINRIGVVAHLI